jgi:rSAM/selenodomain-associated transferase 2
MKISVIIPALNEEKLLPDLLDYLQAQVSSEVEILVVDGGSVDKTIEQTIQKNVVCIQTKLQNRAAQLNLGASKAHGDIFYFLHADGRPPVGFEQDILEAIKKGYPMGGYRLALSGKKGSLTGINSFLTRFNILLLQGGGDQSMFILRSMFESLGGYDDRFVIMEDFEFIRRARNRKIKHKILDRPIEVSSRKYSANHFMKVQWANLVAYISFCFRVSPVRIKARYYKMLQGVDRNT